MNQLSPVTAPPVAVVTDQAKALLQFASLRLQAHHILERAANLPGLPEHCRQQALTASKLAGMRLHVIVGRALPHEAEQIATDLRHICRAVDPLVQAIGELARFEFGISEKDVKNYFTDQLLGALDGNAIAIVDECAVEMKETIREQQADYAADRRRDERRE